MNMTKWKWLNMAVGKIRFAPDRNAVYRELEDHIEDHKAALLARDSALTEAEAEAQAVAAMGDPEPLAEELAKLHRPWLGYLWRLSQVLLVLAVLALAAVTVLRFTGDIGTRPGYLWEALTWDYSEYFQAKEEVLRSRAVYRPAGKLEVSGYTVSVKEATLDAVGPDDPYSYRLLYLDLRIRPSWRGECMDLRWAVSSVTDSLGTVYPLGTDGGGKPWWGWRDADSWGDLAPLGQKALVTLWYIPEGVEWVELTFGSGELARTLRVDLTEEVEP